MFRQIPWQSRSNSRFSSFAVGEYDGVSATIEDQIAPFGALTLASAGGWKPIDSNGNEVDLVSVDDQTGATRTWSVSSGRLIANGTPGVDDGVVLTCTTDLGEIQVTIDAEADVYSFKDATEFAAIIAVGVATISGKTFKGRAGDYTWTDATLNNKTFTSTTTITSHDNDNRLRFLTGGAAAGSSSLRAGTNLTFSQVNFLQTFIVGTHTLTSAGLYLKDSIDGVVFDDCDFESNAEELIAEGNAANDVGFRGALGTDGTSSLGTGGLIITDCTVRGGHMRGFNLVNNGGTGPLTISRNEIRDFIADGMVIGGPQHNIEVNDNVIWSPNARASNQYNVASVDVANDRMTLTVPHNFGAAATVVTINVLPTSTSVPGGLTAMTDYACTVIDETTIEFNTADITSEGSGVIIWEEPPHGDFIQMAPSEDAVVRGEILRNICAAIRDDAAVFVDEYQGIFIEDLNGTPNPDTTHPNLLIEGNLVYAQTTQGIFVANAYNTHIIGNTIVAPPSTPVNRLGPITVGDHFSGTRAGNVIRDNIAKTFSVNSPSAGSTISNNVIAYPDAVDIGGSEKYTDVFVNPGAPTSIAELLTMYAIKASGPADVLSPKAGSVGTGYFDYSANTSSHPSTPADMVGPVLSAVAGTATSDTTADLEATTDTSNGTIYWVVSTSATRPTPAQMIAGQDSSGSAAAYADSDTVSGTSLTESATGLAAETTYYVHALHVDANGNYSVVEVSGSSFTTDEAAAGGPPSFVTALNSHGGVEANTTLPVTLHADIEAGDIILIIWHGTGTLALPGTPSGFTLEDSDPQDTASQDSNTAIYWKIATGSETDFNFVHASAINQGYMLRIIRDGIDLEGVVTAQTTGAVTNPDPASLTPSWGSAENLWIAGLCHARATSRTISAYPTGYTDNQLSPEVLSVASIDIRMGICSKLATGTVDDPSAFTMSASGFATTFTIAVRPA